MIIHAWGDESGSHAASDPGAYILAAAVAEVQHIEEMRTAMESLRLKSSGQKLHWVDETSKRRAQIAATIAELPVESFVVVRKGPPSDKPERRRKKCLETMFQTLTDLGCATLALESRGSRDDERDRQLLDKLRRGHKLHSSLKLSHAKGPTDPMLWMADALCGAVSDDRNGEPTSLRVITRKVDIQLI